MTIQLNLKFQDEFYNLAQRYAKAKGYLTIQELLRESLREKIFDDLELQESYKKTLTSKEANTFLTEEQSKEFEAKLQQRTEL